MQLRRQSQFNARKKFQFAILCVRAMIRIQRLRFTPEPLDIEEAMRDPYRVKMLRKVRLFLTFLWLTIDNIYFTIAGYRCLCFPSLWTLGEERRRTESCRTFRELTKNGTPQSLHQQSQSIKFLNWKLAENYSIIFRFLCFYFRLIN